MITRFFTVTLCDTYLMIVLKMRKKLLFFFFCSVLKLCTQRTVCRRLNMAPWLTCPDEGCWSRGEDNVAHLPWLTPSSVSHWDKIKWRHLASKCNFLKLIYWLLMNWELIYRVIAQTLQPCTPALTCFTSTAPTSAAVYWMTYTTQSPSLPALSILLLGHVQLAIPKTLSLIRPAIIHSSGLDLANKSHWVFSDSFPPLRRHCRCLFKTLSLPQPR